MILAAIFVAIIIVMTVVPYTGYIAIPPSIAITTLHIPVIIGAIFLGWKYGALLGGVWGVTCVIKAFLEPDPANIPFQNPLISLFPRIVVGIVAGAVYALIAKHMKNKLGKPVAAIASAVAATLTNTVLVLSMYSIFNNAYDSLIEGVKQTLSWIIGVAIAVNGVIELTAAIIIVPVVCTALLQVKSKN